MHYVKALKVHCTVKTSTFKHTWQSYTMCMAHIDSSCTLLSNSTVCSCTSNCVLTHATNLQWHSQRTLIHNVEIANCCLRQHRNNKTTHTHTHSPTHRHTPTPHTLNGYHNDLFS